MWQSTARAASTETGELAHGSKTIVERQVATLQKPGLRTPGHTLYRGQQMPDKHTARINGITGKLGMQRTPLFDQYNENGAKVVDFHGWALPIQFIGIVAEHLHTRTKAGLFDCSHMGEFLLTGSEAIDALDRIVCSDITGLKTTRCRYSAFLNEQGGIIDDCVAVRLSEQDVYLVTNAGPLDEICDVLPETINGIKHLSEETTKIDLQGPLSRDILLEVGLSDIESLRHWQGIRSSYKGEDIIITRAGYTGELGYELFVPNAIGPDLWQTLAAHPEVQRCGLGARDTLRTEVGYALNGEDLSKTRTPLESGMEHLIHWDKEFTGKQALITQKDNAKHNVLVAIKSSDRRSPRPGFKIRHDGIEVGEVTSGTYGPSVGCGVGLAQLPIHLAAAGTSLTAGPKELPIETAEIPIYKEGTYRIKFE